MIAALRTSTIAWWYGILLIPMLMSFIFATNALSIEPDSPELAVKKTIDVGLVSYDSAPLSFNIPITNKSGRQISISRLSKDCSCTSLALDRSTLGPGDTAFLHVDINLTGKSGKFYSQLVIQSDSREKLTEIQIQGQVIGQIRIRPERGSLFIGRNAKPAYFTVYCDEENGNWKYLGCDSSLPDLIVTLNRATKSPIASVYNAVANLRSNNTDWIQKDYYENIITLHFYNESMKKTLDIKFPIDCVTRKQYSVQPAVVLFDSSTIAQSRRVLVQAEDAFTIDSIQCNAAFLTYKIKQINDKSCLIDIDKMANSFITVHQQNWSLKCLDKNNVFLASIPVMVMDTSSPQSPK